MMQRAFFSAFAAILLSAVLVQTAAAYPITARSGTTSVTGAYRPLNLDLTTLVNGTDALAYSVDTGLSFAATLTGTFTGVGYTASGSDAGNWRLVLSETFDAGINSTFGGNIISMSSTAGGLQVGTLTYLGGLSVDIGSLPTDGTDTPILGDFFKLFTTAAGTVFDVFCNDGVATCNNFELTGRQDLEHIGPFIASVQTLGGASILDTSRLNRECETAGAPVPCGSVTRLTASSVPEPATLALLGLRLAGLSLSRRTRI